MTLTELAASVANYRNDYAKVKAELDASYQAWLAETQPLGDAVNELKDALPLLFDALKPQGRLLALTFHSLEDRIVKNFIKEITKLPPDTIPKFIPIRNADHHEETKANVICNLVASAEEVDANPRSRSARLRGVEKK